MKLTVGLARFPREAAVKRKMLAGLQTPEADILIAMNVANDAFAKIRRDRYFERRARSELQLLERIALAEMADADRCEASFMLIDGALPDQVDKFIAKEESARREAAQQGQ
jgi:hypothetical protein